MSTADFEITPERVARFWSKVNVAGPDECWTWGGTARYGKYEEWVGNRRAIRIYAHRMSLLIAGIPIDGLVVRHDCDNPPCVNPAHLRTGTQADNMRDAMERERTNTSGLAIGQAKDRPPRDCKRCGTLVTVGHATYCTECRRVVRNEINKRWRDKQAGLTPLERAALDAGVSAA